MKGFIRHWCTVQTWRFLLPKAKKKEKQERVYLNCVMQEGENITKQMSAKKKNLKLGLCEMKWNANLMQQCNLLEFP